MFCVCNIQEQLLRNRKTYIFNKAPLYWGCTRYTPLWLGDAGREARLDKVGRSDKLQSYKGILLQQSLLECTWHAPYSVLQF
jgi:hypothetical protein